MKYTAHQENYLKCLYHLQGQEANVSTNALAHALKTKPASVTDMMKKLHEMGLVIYQPYKGFQLSSKGEKVAVGIVRKHRLWEYFLVEKLQFGWEEVHEIAEELEHIQSKQLIDRLDAYLEFPEADPHGDPIPDAKGNLRTRSWIALGDVALSNHAVIRQIRDQSPEMLDLLKHKHLQLGATVQVIKKFKIDRSITLSGNENQTIELSELVAQNLLVEVL